MIELENIKSNEHQDNQVFITDKILFYPEIINLIEKCTHNSIKLAKTTRGYPNLAFIDLDGTLLNNFQRQKIIYKKQIQKKFPELRKIDLSYLCSEDKKNPYSILPMLKSFISSSKYEKVKQIFIKYFFSNAYLHFDQLNTDIINTIHFLQKLNYEIIFLTGRPQERMQRGTMYFLNSVFESFFGLEFTLIMKPEDNFRDLDFKLDVVSIFTNFYSTKNQSIIFIDNEAEICSAIQKIENNILVIQALTNQSNSIPFRGYKFKFK